MSLLTKIMLCKKLHRQISFKLKLFSCMILYDLRSTVGGASRWTGATPNTLHLTPYTPTLHPSIHLTACDCYQGTVSELLHPHPYTWNQNIQQQTLVQERTACSSHKICQLNDHGKSTSNKNRQMIVLIRNGKQQVDVFVGDLTV